MPKVKIIASPKAKNGAAFSPEKAKKILREKNPTLQGHPISAKQKRWLGWQAGGAKADDGASITPIGDRTFEFNGPSHDQGGIPFSYGGRNVEVEGNETAYKDLDGDMNIMGNMTVPGMDKKFKQVSKDLADKERKVNKRIDDGVKLINTSNPDNKWDMLKFNSGVANLKGGMAKKREITQNKEWLATLQQAMLDHANELGVDPQAYSKGNLEARNGLKMHSTKAQAGDHLKGRLEDILNEYKASIAPRYDSTAPRIGLEGPGVGTQRFAPPKVDINQIPVTDASSFAGAFGAQSTTSTNRRLPAYRMKPTDFFSSDKRKVTTVSQPSTTTTPTNIQPPTLGTSKTDKKVSTPSTGVSVSDRHNNPGNLKFMPWMTKYGATQGEYAKLDDDGTYFAKFPDIASGQKAMRDQLLRPKYVGQTVEDAINMWTNGNPYNIPLGGLSGKKIGELSEDELNQLTGIITKGEGSKVYNNLPATTPTTEYKIPTDITGYKQPEKLQLTGDNINQLVPDQYKFNQVTPGQPYTPDFPYLKRRVAPSNADNLKMTQIAGELYALGTNKQVPVWQAKYQPDLHTPYQVSFQDKLNEDTATFNALRRSQAYNPEALATLAGQKYGADQSVLGEQFRTNQAISNDIINKNVSLLNDAQLKNLSLADTQYTRQAEGRAKTKATNQAVLNSISNKILQKELENRTLKAYENLYPYYRFDKDGNIVNYAPPALEQLNFKNVGQLPINTGQGPGNVATSTTINAKGQVSTRYTTANPLKERLWNLEANKLYWQTVPRMMNIQGAQGKRTLAPVNVFGTKAPARVYPHITTLNR